MPVVDPSVGLADEAGTIMSRRLRYQVAVSLDGFIAGPNGEYDWIVMDPAIDFAALFKEFDTAVMGRKTYDGADRAGRARRDARSRRDRLLADSSGGHASGRPHRQRRSARDRRGAEGEAGSRHLALRRRRPLSLAPRRGPRGHGGSCRRSRAPRSRGPASSARRCDEADARRTRRRFRQRDRGALATRVPGGVGPAPRIRYIKAAKTRAKKRTKPGARKRRAKGTHRTVKSPRA